MQHSIPDIIAHAIKRYLQSPEDIKFLNDYLSSYSQLNPVSFIALIREYFTIDKLSNNPLIEGDKLLYNYLNDISNNHYDTFPENEWIISYEKNWFKKDGSLKNNKVVYEDQIQELKKENEDLKKKIEIFKQIRESLHIRDYREIRLLGSGGFGTVHEVEHLISGEHFAVKRLSSENHEKQENILREIKALAPINHPNIINYKNSFKHKNRLFLVMEYCAGGSLMDRLLTKGKLPEEELVRLFLILTKTFSFLHAREIIHHDIKPSNILFTSDGDIKVSDFGAVNTKIGTPAYYAPELYDSSDSISDPRTDIFSLGVTLLECALGYNPFASISWHDNMLKIKNSDLPVNMLSGWLQELIFKSVSYYPEDRFQNMEEFHEAIQKKDIPVILSHKLIEKEIIARKLKSFIQWKKWIRAGKLIQALPELPGNETNLNLLVEAGKYYIQISNIEKARQCFEKAMKVNTHAPIEKQIAEVYLQTGEISKAAAILQAYINRNFLDFEAHNQLLYSYFLANRWELGLEQSKLMLEISPDNDVFQSNHILFLILTNESLISSINESGLPVFARYNIEVLQENNPESWNKSKGPSLQSKLLFQDYKFKNIERSENVLEIKFNGKSFEKKDFIISFGREGYNYNSFKSFSGTSISRRHFVIINMKNNVWLYDLESATGTSLNETKINKKAFILGLNEIQIGEYIIEVKSDKQLLL